MSLGTFLQTTDDAMLINLIADHHKARSAWEADNANDDAWCRFEATGAALAYWVSLAMSPADAALRLTRLEQDEVAT